MIAVVSCHHFPDDERIYHREIKTLLKHDFFIQYYTRSKNSIDLSKTGLIHVNSSQNFSISDYSQKVYKQLNKNRPLEIFHFHEEMSKNVLEEMFFKTIVQSSNPFLLKRKLFRGSFALKMIFRVQEIFCFSAPGPFEKKILILFPNSL